MVGPSYANHECVARPTTASSRAARRAPTVGPQHVEPVDEVDEPVEVVFGRAEHDLGGVGRKLAVLPSVVDRDASGSDAVAVGDEMLTDVGKDGVSRASAWVMSRDAYRFQAPPLHPRRALSRTPAPPHVA